MIDKAIAIGDTVLGLIGFETGIDDGVAFATLRTEGVVISEESALRIASDLEIENFRPQACSIVPAGSATGWEGAHYLRVEADEVAWFGFRRDNVLRRVEV